MGAKAITNALSRAQASNCPQQLGEAIETELNLCGSDFGQHDYKLRAAPIAHDHVFRNRETV